jgi:hypothetical protein
MNGRHFHHPGEAAQQSSRVWCFIKLRNSIQQLNSNALSPSSIESETLRGVRLLSVDELNRVSGAKMSWTIPDTMRSLCIYSYRPPSEYEISTIPTPRITLPNHVLVKVAAGSINPADMEQGRGISRWLLPYRKAQRILLISSPKPQLLIMFQDAP